MRPYEAERLVHQAAARILGGMPKGFVQREDGTITVFATVVFVLMIGVGGIAIDLMRYEAQRTQLQYTLDRAVLAAAALDQEKPAQDVVQNYFETAGLGNYRLRVTVDEGINARRVTASAEMEMNTMFMRLFGQRVLSSPAAGAAEERIPNIEVSLVLDISGSMEGTRMTNLQPAARDFVTSMLASNTNDIGQQFVSISVIPYNGHVNVGTTLSSVYALTGEHNYSRCSRFDWNDFTVSGLNPAVPIQRMAHFDIESTTWSDPIVRPRCPRDDTGAIIPWSNSEADMHQLINSLTPQGSTAIDAGMRWAVALLDPLARPALNGLTSNGTVHADFTDRPAAYADPNTIKVVVMMTDGENTAQYDVNPSFRSGPAPFGAIPMMGISRSSTASGTCTGKKMRNCGARFPMGAATTMPYGWTMLIYGTISPQPKCAKTCSTRMHGRAAILGGVAPLKRWVRNTISGISSTNMSGTMRRIGACAKSAMWRAPTTSSCSRSPFRRPRAGRP